MSPELRVEGPAQGGHVEAIYRWWPSEAVEVLRALMAEAQINAAFGERFRAGFLQRRRDALGVLVNRALTRGDLPPDPRAETIADIVFGVIWYRVLATREPVDDALVDELVSLLGAGDTPTRASGSRR